MKLDWAARPVDRAVLFILAAVNAANGLYLVGPWYLVRTPDGKAPLYNLLEAGIAIDAYGLLLILSAIALTYCASRRHVSLWVVSYVLLATFMLRLYALIGTIIILESWRPPSYTSQVGMTLLVGIYWVFVKLSARERPTG